MLKISKHITIIMDGNGHWAKTHGRDMGKELNTAVSAEKLAPQ